MRDGDRVDGHLLIGHTHWDHIQGLPFFAPLFEAGNVWHVYGPRGLDSSIDKALEGQMQYTYFPVQLLDFDSTIEFHDLVEGQFEIDDITVTTRYLHHPALTLGYRIEADGVTVVYSTDHEPTVARPSPDPEDLEKVEPSGGAARRVPPRRRPRDPRRAVPRRGVPGQGGMGPQHGRVRGRCRAARPRRGGSRCSTTIRPAPTKPSTRSSSRARARAREIGFTGEVFAAAEGATRSRCVHRYARRRDPPVDTATRTPALADLPRAVLIAVGNVDADAALHEAARAEGFETLVVRRLRRDPARRPHGAAAHRRPRGDARALARRPGR